MFKYIDPNTGKICQYDFPKVGVLKLSTKGAMVKHFVTSIVSLEYWYKLSLRLSQTSCFKALHERSNVQPLS